MHVWRRSTTHHYVRPVCVAASCMIHVHDHDNEWCLIDNRYVTTPCVCVWFKNGTCLFSFHVYRRQGIDASVCMFLSIVRYTLPGGRQTKSQHDRAYGAFRRGSVQQSFRGVQGHGDGAHTIAKGPRLIRSYENNMHDRSFVS